MIEGALSELECAVLGGVAALSNAHDALEVGHWRGLSTSILLDNLPEGCPLTTIDHHLGDQWIHEAYPPEKFYANVADHINGRPFTFHCRDMIEVMEDLGYRYDFVFYDADHAFPGIEKWWAAIGPHLASHCTLAFDDADWEDQACLTGMAMIDGFEIVTDRPFYRGDEDKSHPDCYTLQVMTR